MRIAVIGPESSGKSTLAASLSKKFKLALAAEFSRQYLHDLGRPYDYTDLMQIALGQEDVISRTSSNSNASVIADTEAISIKVWSVIKYKKNDPQIDEIISRQNFDIYLLCKSDLDWEEDDLRESPSQQERDLIFKTFQKELTQRDLPYAIIEGYGEKRTECALEVLKRRYKP